MNAALFSPLRSAGLIRLAVASLIAYSAAPNACAHHDADLLELPLEQLLNLDVSTASKFQQKAADAPSSVTVVTAAEIKAFGWRSLADILASMRGLYVTNDSNYSYLGGRGFARPGDYNTRFLLLVDGVRSNDAIYDQAAIGRDFIIDVDMIERVEYVPGSGSSIYGSNAFFGVINVITKNANQFNHPYGSVEIGSEGERKASASYGIRDKNGAQLLLSATTFRRKGEDQYYPAFNTPANNFGVARNLDYERGGNVLIKGTMGPFALSLAHVERERGIPTASFEQAFNDPRARTKDAQTNAALTYQSELDSQTSVMARLFWGQHVYGGRYAYETELNLDTSKSSWVGSELSLLTSRWRNHKVLAGVEFQRDYQRDQFSANQYPAGSLDAPVYSDAEQRFTLLDTHNPGSRAGLYLQDEITLRNDLLLNIGGRYDFNSETPSAFSPRLAVIYKLEPNTTLKAITGSAFRAPNAYEQYYIVDTSGGQIGNPDLKPERIRSRELVLEHRFAQDARLLVSAFRNEVSDLISITDTGGLAMYRNLSRATAKGLELEYEQSWTNGVRLRASQSWQKTVDGDTGARLVNSPISLSNLNVMVPVLQHRATAGLEASYVGARKTLNGSLDGFWLANATLSSSHLIDHCDVSLSVYNLFDRQYGDPGGTEHVQDAIPQPGRSFRIKVSRSF